MSTHENPRQHGPVAEPDRQTSEGLLDGREQEHPLADFLASAGAPASSRELRREAEAVHAFASREVLDARAATVGLATERTRMRSRRTALAAALRPVPLAKAMLATTVAVVAAFALAGAVTGPADPVDSTSPAGLSAALEAGTTTSTTADPTTTTTTAAEPTSTTTKTTRRPGVRPPAACAAWWGWAKSHRHKTWPTTWPTEWPTTWPTEWPTRIGDTEPTSPTAKPSAAPSGPADGPGVRPDRQAWRACFGHWNKHHPRSFGERHGYDHDDPDGDDDGGDDDDRYGDQTDRDHDHDAFRPGTGGWGGGGSRDDEGGSEGGARP